VEEPASARGVQAIVRALSVLRAFSPERSTLSVSEIAPIVGVSVPTAHRIATTLQNQGYLSRDPATKAFSLGPELLRLATLISETRPQTVDLRVLTAIRAATRTCSCTRAQSTCAASGCAKTAACASS